MFSEHLIRKLNNMYQSVLSITIPPGNPGKFDQNFCPGGRDLTRARHLT